MAELRGKFNEGDLETAGFYARQVVDRVTYQELKDDFGLPDYDQMDDGEMIELATMVLSGEFRELHDNIEYSRGGYSQDGFVERALELSGEPVQEPYMIQKTSSQLGDEPVDSEEVDAWMEGITADSQERPPGEVELEREKESHRWINVADLAGEFNSLHNAYLPVVELDDSEEEADLDEWP